MPDKRRSSKVPRERKSCDICQTSKIGCGQERPACARCVKQNLECVYSLSRRVGRPRPKKNETDRRDSQARRVEDGTMPTRPVAGPSTDVGRSHSNDSTAGYSPSYTAQTSDYFDDVDIIYVTNTGSSATAEPRVNLYTPPASEDYDQQQLLNDLSLFTSMDVDMAPPEPRTPVSPTSVVHPRDLHTGWNPARNLNGQTSRPNTSAYYPAYSNAGSYSNPEPHSDISETSQPSSSVRNSMDSGEITSADLFLPFDVGSALTFDWSMSDPSNIIASEDPEDYPSPLIDIPLPFWELAPDVSGQPTSGDISPKTSCTCSADLLDVLAAKPAASTGPGIDINDNTFFAAAVQRSKCILASCTNVLDCKACAPKLSSALLLCEAMNAVSLALGMGSLWSTRPMMTNAISATITDSASSSAHQPPRITSSSSTATSSPPSGRCISSALARNEVAMRCGSYNVRGAERRLMLKALVMKRLTDMQGALHKLRLVVQTTDVANAFCQRTCADLARDLENKVAVRVEQFRNLQVSIE
ncbi:uncharacterized protein RCC_09410 [Ramularia collo-cygni]|uniref:Zn(2)-C6 fungal-type domain-containing protein n=1 Tax=Ramularia collo-cygni TaxID=112498 RepID=A0A2D3V2U8_9PEZI|nr:uncharacterized protein RCC_09410 [Ramularia collo-cygni]CZT23696.1 uncharacterized protein RCC_09410 [Ramularia collo-cygni]